MSVMIGGEADVACPDITSNGSDLRCPTHASGYRVAGGRASGNDRPGRPAARQVCRRARRQINRAGGKLKNITDRFAGGSRRRGLPGIYIRPAVTPPDPRRQIKKTPLGWKGETCPLGSGYCTSNQGPQPTSKLHCTSLTRKVDATLRSFVFRILTHLDHVASLVHVD